MSAPYKPFDFSTSEIRVIDPAKLARELGNSDVLQKSGRVAVTVAREARMTVVLTVVKQGAEIHEHEAPGPVTLWVVSGRVGLRPESGGGSESLLDAGSCAVFSPEVRHSVVGLLDSIIVIVIGGR
jgi:quercetin dioxygenase-like cupin family protein